MMYGPAIRLGDGVDCALAVHARHAEPGCGEDARRQGEGDGVDRRWGDAGLECVAHGGLDSTGERVDSEIRKVGGPAAGASLDHAVGVADDGGRLGAAAVDAEVQRHGGGSERVSGKAGGVCGVYI